MDIFCDGMVLGKETSLVWYDAGKGDIFNDDMVLGKGTSFAMVWCWEKGHLLCDTMLGKGTSLVLYDAGKGDMFSYSAAQSLWQFQHHPDQLKAKQICCKNNMKQSFQFHTGTGQSI